MHEPSKFGEMTCDKGPKFTKRWYRFSGEAGTAIAGTCPSTHHCGAIITGWMNGTHPTQEEGIVTRRSCFHFYKKCCNWKKDIRVRNCGDFYVYELDTVPFCDARYCSDEKGNHLINSQINNELQSHEKKTIEHDP